MSPQGLFPRSGPRAFASKAEIKFYKALEKHLPKGWAAWHSMKLRVPKGREAEGDFVIAIPGRGALIVEVKGGRIEVEDGIWLQNGRRLEKAPRDQAHGCLRVLLQQLEIRHPDHPEPFITIATAFPDIEWENPPSQGDLEGAVLGAQDLPYLGDALVAMVDRLFKDMPAPSWPWEAALHELWGESWLPALSLGTRTRLTETKLVQLDEEQRDLLDTIDDNPRLHVAGPPGTGKTLLAVELANRWRKRGMEPLLLCFTRALAQNLRSQGDDAHTVRELAAILLSRAGVVIEDGKPQELWTQETWNGISARAAEVLPKLRLEYDAIIVVEAQDLAEDDWELVRALDRGGPLWAFGDEAQGFWRERREIPQDMRPFTYRLKRRYRCPLPLTQFADRYRPEGITDDEMPSFSHELILLDVPHDSVELGVALSIEQLLEDGVSLSQIAVLSLAGQSRTSIGRASRMGAFEAVRADDDEAGDKLIADTFLRFKGLERPFIIVTELGMGEKNYDVRMHIALTRATVGVIIVATKEEAEKDERLGLLLRKGSG